MEPIMFLLVLSIAMLVGSYVAGSLPLSTKLSDKKIRLFNALGAGLLIGTSLMVVIPEGIETIYNSKATELANIKLPQSQLATIPDFTITDFKGNQMGNEDYFELVTKRTPTVEEEESGGEHTAIGLALLVGFALMFIIDQSSSLHMTVAPSADYNELNTMGSLEQEEQANESNVHHIQSPPSMTPTVGLVVHAAADGIALGASASHPQLSMVVFMAIMLHKAPASFALTSVLLASGLSHTTIRKHLFIFALAAPLGALITYFSLLFFSSTSPSTLEYWTGLLLIFSGGTFLYVAMHALQEVSQHPHHSTNKKSENTTMYVILVGMMIPILLNMSHSH